MNSPLLITLVLYFVILMIEQYEAVAMEASRKRSGVNA
jgi:hypothetical protein